MTDQETRKRLIINRHIFKMGPEEIARRFAIAISQKTGRNQPTKQRHAEHGMAKPKPFPRFS